VLRRFGHALKRALLDRSLLADMEQLTASHDPAPAAESRIAAHIAAHLPYYSATIIAAGDPMERSQALARLTDAEGRPLTDVIENVVVGRVGQYVAFPLRAPALASRDVRAALAGDQARLLRASDEATVTLPVRGVWLRVQLSPAVVEGAAEVEQEKRETRNAKRGTAG
jgi:hypothetical protein